MYDVTVIGAAIVDVLAGPVDMEAAGRNSQPVENIKMSFGGDATVLIRCLCDRCRR